MTAIQFLRSQGLITDLEAGPKVELETGDVIDFVGILDSFAATIRAENARLKNDLEAAKQTILHLPIAPGVQEENKALRAELESHKKGIADIFADNQRCGVEILKLRAENAQLREALQGLYDEQNGAPLSRREEDWFQAYRKAGAALNSTKPDPLYAAAPDLLAVLQR